MASQINNFARVSTILAADVANSGTFTVAYPSGTSVASFNAGTAATSTAYMVVNGNDRWTVAASKMSLSYGASLVTVTNSTGATLAAGSLVDIFLDLVDGNTTETFAFPVNLASVTTTQDVVTDFRPGIYGTIEYVQFVQNIPVTTASKLATITPAVDGTATTGGAVALTSAACTPMGATIAGSAITAGGAITPASKLSLKATSVTAFSEGSGTYFVRVRKTPPGSFSY